MSKCTKFIPKDVMNDIFTNIADSSRGGESSGLLNNLKLLLKACSSWRIVSGKRLEFLGEGSFGAVFKALMKTPHSMPLFSSYQIQILWL